MNCTNTENSKPVSQGASPHPYMKPSSGPQQVPLQWARYAAQEWQSNALAVTSLTRARTAIVPKAQRLNYLFCGVSSYQVSGISIYLTKNPST